MNPELQKIDEATGLTLEELLREQHRREAVAEANADPLPGPLALAFPAKPIRVGAFSIRPLVGVDIAILRHLDSPLLKQMAEARKPVAERQPTAFTDQDGWDMCFQFLLPPERAEIEILKGREVFQANARGQIGLRMNPVIIGQIVSAVSEQFSNAFTTAVEFSKADGGEADNSFFTTPPAAPKTAPAGGSNSSAA